MKILQIILICTLILASFSVFANKTDSKWGDEAIFVGTIPKYGSEASSLNFWSTFMIFEHGYDQWVNKNLSGIPRWTLGFIWQFFITYEFVVWPHEVGHWIRHREFGHQFIVLDLSFPRPEGTSKYHNETDLDVIMGILGGVEANHLTALNIQKEFYQREFGYSDSFTALFLHKFMYTFYTYVMNRGNADDIAFWLDEPGDPTQFVKQWYKLYFGKDSISPGPVPEESEGASVDPSVPRLYKEMNILGFWSLLDPMTYWGWINAVKRISTGENRTSVWWFKTGALKWMYGTQFNLSPMGYELYLHLYAKWKNQFAIFYARWGRPETNVGVGLELPELFKWQRFHLGFGIDVWNQAIFNWGINLHALPIYWLTPDLRLVAKVGWKTDGYILAQPLLQDVYGWAGLRFSY
jgi:hypothetical protein